ncbi:MAG: hypothetical protein WBA23_14715, partial [Tunicatimonas sp.]|uniref:hypothetical protein n=1 Tax=Tunicatimonas sp. TaxID=1940096 RepID=UPI003C71160A
KKDFQKLFAVIRGLENLIVLPNVWTEVDNLLNNFLSGNFKWPYIKVVRESISKTSEKYLNSELGVNSDYFIKLGLTDSLLLELAKNCDLLITADSDLSDTAKAHGIAVYDLKEERNKDFIE